MQQTVLLFGPQAKLVGATSVHVDLDENATAADVLVALQSACPALNESIGASRLAINHVFAASESAISESDELALIGMVSGG